ncbi:MAG: DMT family transporter [Hormoscilla sp. GUM202]|nr:DMT family transporter [Hormoscilla sp. GUM202]
MLFDFWIENYRGELAALSGACLWATASVVYTYLGRSIPPLLLNLSKGAIGIAFILFALILQGDFAPSATPRAIGLLTISGVVGIGLGDSFFFEALNHLGARRALLIEALAPPLTAVFALIFLQEQLSISNWSGIFITVFGVSWVISERVPEVTGKQRQHPLRGTIFALLAALGQASGAVLSRSALSQSDISPLWSTLFRLVAGVLVILLILPSQRQGKDWLKSLGDKQLIGIIILTSFAGTFLGIWLQQTAFKYTAAGIAQALLATSPLFVLPIVICMGERVSKRALAGVLVAIAGIFILFN